MLPKQHRLPLRKELKRVQKSGKLFQGRLFTLLLAKGDDRKPARFGFIISSKIHKKAVRRNRVRRLLAESIKDLLPTIRDGFDGVFLVKKGIVGKELSEVKNEVRQVFFNAKLLDNNHALLET
jgi:ribonuclease P protein component